MRAYADSSFILRLVTTERGSPDAIVAFRHLGRPALFFLALHSLEVRNAILQRAFHQRRSSDSTERRHVARERDAAFGRLDRLIAHRTLVDLTLDMEAVFTRAAALSGAHTERLGARAIDLLHVAAALTTNGDLFMTADTRQARLARAEGLRVLCVD